MQAKSAFVQKMLDSVTESALVEDLLEIERLALETTTEQIPQLTKSYREKHPKEWNAIWEELNPKDAHLVNVDI